MGLIRFIFRILGAQSPIHIWFFSILSRPKKIGRDCFGNKYFEAKPRKGYNHPRRFVIYNGDPEPSTVPPEWHGWLHYQTDVIPDDNTPSYRHFWQKPPRPNMTGTPNAYHPSGHLLSGGLRDKATGDYEAWAPKSSSNSQSRR